MLPEVEPISTYVDFGEREFLVADERGYECLLYKMAEEFLFASDGNILDNRLKLNKVKLFLLLQTPLKNLSLLLHFCNGIIIFLIRLMRLIDLF